MNLVEQTLQAVGIEEAAKPTRRITEYKYVARNAEEAKTIHAGNIPDHLSVFFHAIGLYSERKGIGLGGGFLHDSLRWHTDNKRKPSITFEIVEKI